MKKLTLTNAVTKTLKLEKNDQATMLGIGPM